MSPLSRARAEFGDHPHALRTWVRGRLPWFLIRLGFAGFGKDCAALGAQHNWYGVSEGRSRCIFCGTEREGELWRSSPYRSAVVWHDLEAAARHRR